MQSKNKPFVSNNSGNNEWYTPPEYIEKARRVMGSIDVDPASSALAQTIVNASVYYTILEDGLDKEWNGNVWMNPPYARKLIGMFTDKLVEQIDKENVCQAIVLVNNQTESAWFSKIISKASAVGFTKKRIKFIDEKGFPSGAPLQGQSVIYIGDSPKKFVDEFKDICWCAYLWEVDYAV